MHSESHVSKTSESALHIDQEIFDKIDALDLECIKVKLVYPEEGEGWTRQQANEIEILYKRFLYMAAALDEIVYPTRQIDKFWHAHIMDTQKYAQDCQKIFGRFLHHFPYSGMRGPEDRERLQQGFEKTRTYHNTIFGGDYGSGESADCEENHCSSVCSGPTGCGGSSEDFASIESRPSFELMESLARNQ